MSSSTSLPQHDAIEAFFATDKSLGRFVEFLKRYLFSVPVTNSACAVVLVAAANMDTTKLPSPACDFFASEQVVESSQGDLVRRGAGGIVSPLGVGLQAGAEVTFGWLLARQTPSLAPYDTIRISDIDFQKLTAVLATASRTSYPGSNGEACDHCCRSNALVVGECRQIGATDMLDDLGLPVPTCSNCLAADVDCTWGDADE